MIWYVIKCILNNIISYGNKPQGIEKKYTILNTISDGPRTIPHQAIINNQINNTTTTITHNKNNTNINQTNNNMSKLMSSPLAKCVPILDMLMVYLINLE